VGTEQHEGEESRMARDVKPLTRAQREAAVKIATADKRVKSGRKARLRPVLAAPNLHDPAQPTGGEQVVVGFYDYDRGRSIVALVDPKERKVLGVEETEAHLQLSDEEKREAEGLAAKDERVKGFLARRRADPLTRLYFPPGGARQEPPHRHAIVFLRPTSSERRYAVVDLSEGRTVDVLESLTG
jgi:hypothetical protein